MVTHWLGMILYCARHGMAKSIPTDEQRAYLVTCSRMHPAEQQDLVVWSLVVDCASVLSAQQRLQFTSEYSFQYVVLMVLIFTFLSINISRVLPFLQSPAYIYHCRFWKVGAEDSL